MWGPIMCWKLNDGCGTNCYGMFYARKLGSKCVNARKGATTKPCAHIPCMTWDQVCAGRRLSVRSLYVVNFNSNRVQFEWFTFMIFREALFMSNFFRQYPCCFPYVQLHYLLYWPTKTSIVNPKYCAQPVHNVIKINTTLAKIQVKDLNCKLDDSKEWTLAN